MKIGLLSDTHSYFDPEIKEIFKDSDEIWHAGDIGNHSVIANLEEIAPTKVVFGNIDDGEARLRWSENEIFNCGGMKVWMTHIGGFPPKYPKKIRQKLIEIKPDIFICGHSHILRVMWDKEHELLHMNPGACGRTGFHRIRTMIKFEIINSEVKNAQIVELGSRSTLMQTQSSV